MTNVANDLAQNPSSAVVSTDDHEQQKEIPRWVGALLDVVSIPALAVNVVMGGVLLVAAYNCWTNMNKRPFWSTGNANPLPDGALKQKNTWGCGFPHRPK